MSSADHSDKWLTKGNIIVAVVITVSVSFGIGATYFALSGSNGHLFTNLDTTTKPLETKHTYIANLMVCPDGYASKYLQTPTRNNDTFVTQCSNEGVFITSILTRSDHWDSLPFVTKDVMTMAYTDHYGSQVLRGIGNNLYEILKPAKPQIQEGDIVIVHKWNHHQPNTPTAYEIILSNGTKIFDIKLIHEIMANQTQFGLTENILGFIESTTDNQNTYADYIIQDLNYTDTKLGKAPYFVDESEDG